MNILAKAMKLKNQRIIEQKSNENLEKIAYEKRQKDYDSSKEQVWNALKSLSKSKNFKLTKSDSNLFGEIAYLEKYIGFGKGIPRQLELLGTICLQYYTYNFRGADDCPEQEIQGQCLCMQRILNTDDYIIRVNTDRGLEKAIKEFIEQLIEFLSKEID